MAPAAATPTIPALTALLAPPKATAAFLLVLLDLFFLAATKPASATDETIIDETFMINFFYVSIVYVDIKNLRIKKKINNFYKLTHHH